MLRENLSHFETSSVCPNETSLTPTALRWLKRSIQHSSYKLFFIRRPHQGQTNPNWFLVQVNQPETDSRDTEDWDMYRVKWWIRHHQDSKTSLQCNCRFWPEVHKLNPNVSLGPTQPVNLTKADGFIKPDPQVYKWYPKTTHLAEDTLVGMFGKFDFDPEYKIPSEAWRRLQANAAL